LEFLEEFESFFIENDGSVELVSIFEFCDGTKKKPNWQAHCGVHWISKQ
jgi:hypothetical protein